MRGGFPTGDLGRVDQFGILTITGRIKLLIEVGGQKVNVLELEALLARREQLEHAVLASVVVFDVAQSQAHAADDRKADDR